MLHRSMYRSVSALRFYRTTRVCRSTEQKTASDATTTASGQTDTTDTTATIAKETESDKEFDAKDFCCMSGCQHCVLFDDHLGDGVTAKPGAEAELDPSISAFLAMEKRMEELAKAKSGDQQ